jgi:hypothetical protein
MTGHRYCRLVFVALLATAAAVLSNTPGQGSEKEASKNEIVAALKTGRRFVIVVEPRANPDSSEAYADWAGYLNDFAASEKRLRIIKLTARRYSQMVTAPKLSRPYDTLFVRDADHALLYRGMILEPQIYSIGAAYMKAKSDSASVFPAGLEEVQLKSRP